MHPVLKTIKVKDTVTVITLEHDSTKQRRANGIKIESDIKALAILLGGYNAHGRSVDYDQYIEIKNRFDECVTDLKYLLSLVPEKP